MLASLPPVTPGFYVDGVKASLLRAGGQQYLLQNQSGAGGKTSIAVLLERLKSGFFYPNGVSFEFTFSGAPGTISLEIQTSDTDTDASYVTISTYTGTLNSSNVGRVELTTYWARFIRVKCTTITNAVNITILVTR